MYNNSEGNAIIDNILYVFDKSLSNIFININLENTAEF